jgi:hypothetical protein
VTALLGSLPAAPQPNHHLGKADLGRGHALIEAQPPRQPQPQHLIQVARVKGRLNTTVKTPTYKSLQRESSLQKPPSNSICNANRCKNLYGIILQRNVLHVCNNFRCKNLNRNIFATMVRRCTASCINFCNENSRCTGL